MLLAWLVLHVLIGDVAQPPAFLTGPSSEPPRAIAARYLSEHAGALGLAGVDLDDVVVTSEETSAHNGVTHIYLRQRYAGITISGADVNFNITRDGRILSMGGRFVPNVAQAVNDRAPAADAIAAARAAARSLGLRPTAPIVVREARGGSARETTLSGGGISEPSIAGRLVYHAVTPTKLRLAWQLEIQEPGGQHWWVMTVDATSLAILDTFDRVKSQASR